MGRTVLESVGQTQVASLTHSHLQRRHATSFLSTGPSRHQRAASWLREEGGKEKEEEDGETVTVVVAEGHR